LNQSAALPRWIYAPAVLGVVFVALPLVAMAAKVEWPQFFALIGSRASREALLLSSRTAVGSTALCLVLGVPLALVLPPVVGGIALLYAFGNLGLIGRYLDAAGIQIAFSTTAVVLAQTFVSLPFLVIALEGAARSAGGRHEEVAATLEARPTTVWWRVTLPLEIYAQRESDANAAVALSMLLVVVAAVVVLVVGARRLRTGGLLG
jgi:molybdate transport system permease protein